jgi:hypothetical protein
MNRLAAYKVKVFGLALIAIAFSFTGCVKEKSFLTQKEEQSIVRKDQKADWIMADHAAELADGTIVVTTHWAPDTGPQYAYLLKGDSGRRVTLPSPPPHYNSVAHIAAASAKYLILVLAHFSLGEESHPVTTEYLVLDRVTLQKVSSLQIGGTPYMLDNISFSHGTADFMSCTDQFSNENEVYTYNLSNGKKARRKLLRTIGWTRTPRSSDVETVIYKILGRPKFFLISGCSLAHRGNSWEERSWTQSVSTINDTTTLVSSKQTGVGEGDMPNISAEGRFSMDYLLKETGVKPGDSLRAYYNDREIETGRGFVNGTRTWDLRNIK